MIFSLQQQDTKPKPPSPASQNLTSSSPQPQTQQGGDAQGKPQSNPGDKTPPQEVPSMVLRVTAGLVIVRGSRLHAPVLDSASKHHLRLKGNRQ